MSISAKIKADGLVYVTCPNSDCAAGLRIKPKSAHTNVTCASCGHKFALEVEGMEASAGAAPPPVPPPPSVKESARKRDQAEPRGESSPKSPSRPRHPWEVDDEERRRERRTENRRRKEEKSAPVGLIIAGVAALLILGGGIAAGIVYATRDEPSRPTTPVASGPASDKTVPGASVPTAANTTSPVTSPVVKDSTSTPPSKRKSPPTSGRPTTTETVKKNEPSQDPPKPVEKPKTPPVDPIEVVKKSTALIEGKGGWGTGFVIRPGIVMTNAHVINSFLLSDLTVSFVSLDDTAPPKLKPTLLYTDARRDLAILRVDTDRPPLEITAPGTDLSGMSVAVVGNPRGDAGQAEINKVTRGTLSNPIRRDAGWTYYELRAEAFFGNSGGPVVNEKTGKLVGVMQSILGDGKQKSYCIPYGEAVRALELLPTSKADEPKFTRLAAARHYLDYIADHLPEMEMNAEDAMAGQLIRLQAKAIGASVEIRVRTKEGREFVITLTEFMEQLRSKHTAIYPNLSKVCMPAVDASSEIPSSLRQLMRQRIEAYMNMYSLANQETKTEKGFRDAMEARKSASLKAAAAFKDAYKKFLDDLERKPLVKPK
jgi:S1-C subfamily serine protease